MTPVETDPQLLERMRAEWDERARENARFFIATANEAWTDEQFFESGRQNIRDEILTDMGNICQGKDPKEMKVLEIGCGAGRITRALAEVFGDVYAVDVSGVMIEQAKTALADLPNAHVFQNNGTDLRVLGDIQVDFAFSYIVFQHIPSHEVIYNYVREVHRLLRPGGLFKFQVQGAVADLEQHSEGPESPQESTELPAAPGSGADRPNGRSGNRHVARRSFFRCPGPPYGGGMRLRGALPDRRRHAVFLALVLQEAGLTGSAKAAALSPKLLPNVFASPNVSLFVPLAFLCACWPSTVSCVRRLLFAPVRPSTCGPGVYL
jgi:SAM-dependent methyltransferase